MLTKKSSVLALLFTLCLVAPLALVSSVNLAAGAPTIQVPSTQYPTIQSALNAATNGTTINVAAGTYNEEILRVGGSSYTYLNDVTLQGAGASSIINGNVTFATMHNLKMDNFKIIGTLKVGIGLGGDIQNSVFSNLNVANVDFVNAQTVSLDGSSVGHIQLSAYGMGSGDAGITIQNNVISGGISLGNSGTNKIGGNTINGAAIGIDDQTDYVSWHAPAGNNQIVGNTITNSQIGIKIRSAQMYSTPDTVIQNTIKNCAVGVQIVFKDAPVVIQNSFSLNSFIDNGIQVNCTGPNSDIWSTGTPLKGNYWSDYKGVDANGDGIGDTPYTINAANKDNYPLMYPYGTTPPAPTPTALPTPTTTVTPTPTAVPTPTQTTTHANPSPTPTTNPTTAPTTIPTPTAQPTSNPTSNPADPISQNQNVIPETNFYWAGLLMLAAGISAIFLARKSLTKQPTL